MKKELGQLIALMVIVITIIAGSSVIVGFDNRSVRLRDHEKEQQEQESTTAEIAATEAPTIEIPEEVTPESITGLLIGFDVSGKLTDVLMVGHLDTVTNEVDIISVPRDLKIDFNTEEFKDIKANNPKNHIAYCKINEVYNNVGQDARALEDVKEIISVITGLDIQYMASINTQGFKDVVDAVGGVEFDVPQRMKKTDLAQDLHIDLQPGLQLLDGDKAEQLVRYREYTMGDLQRIQVQQSFMTELYKKVLTTNDFDQLKDLLTSVYGMVETDFGFLELQDYARYIFDLKLEGLLSPEHMVTIPSYSELIDEIWYQDWYIDEAHEAVQNLLND